jgi:hypothetical protein
VDSAVQQHVRDHLRDFVAVKPRFVNRYGRTLWWQRLYVDPATGLLRRTDQLPEEKAYRRAKRNKRAVSVERISVSDDRELRLIRGIWYEARLASLPQPVYRINREIRKLRYVPWSSRSRLFEAEMNVGRLLTPPVRDVVTGAMIAAGPAIDEAESWATYRRAHPDRRYATAKRVLSRRELRRHGLYNSASAEHHKARPM